MSDLTDLEICKRIAAIEAEFDRACDWSVNMCAQLEFGDGENWKVYKPLTDKALCFDLMVKHELSIKLAACKHKGAYCVKWEWTMDIDGGITYDNNPQRAICLTIISKHSQLHDK